MKNKIMILTLSAVFFGCSGSNVDIPNADIAASSEGNLSSKAAINVVDATPDELAPHLLECHGKNAGKICVQICHRPPGNPANSKTLILPLKASLKHLHHGGPHHETKDTLGPCEDLQTDVDPVIVEDESETDPGTGTGSTDPGTVDTTVIGDDGIASYADAPIWCQAYYGIDNNCDGVDNFTGLPLY